MANASKVGKVCGIESTKLSEAAVDAALGKLEIVPAKGMKLAGRVELLGEHFKTLPVARLADCDVCGAPSDIALDCCPFCGEGGTNAAAEVGDPPDADESAGAEPPAEYAEEEPSAAAPPAPAPVEMTHPTTAQPLVDKRAAKAARDAEKATGKAAAKEAKAAAKLVKTPPKQDEVGAAVTQIVPKESAALAGVQQLDADVAEVIRLNRGVCAGSWLLAQKVSEISESQRWKLRLDEQGKVKYRTFEDFARVELQMAPNYARDMQKIYVRFTQDVFEKIGPSKLRLVLQAPADQQEEVLEKIKDSVTPKRALAAEVQERRAKAGLKTSRGEKTKAPEKKPAAEQEKGKLTVAAIIGRQTVKLFKKPEKKGEETSRAKRLADRPYGHIDLGNDTRCWIEVTADAAGELVLKLDIRRIEE